MCGCTVVIGYYEDDTRYQDDYHYQGYVEIGDEDYDCFYGDENSKRLVWMK